MTLAVAVVAAVRTGDARGNQSFPCRWKWDLEAGHRDGYVTAGNSADCTGRRGSVTLSVRLFSWNPRAKRWRLDRAQSKTFTNLSGNRYLELAKPCVTSTVRAVFGWALRDSHGMVVSRNAVTTGTLKVPAVCRFVIR